MRGHATNRGLLVVDIGSRRKKQVIQAAKEMDVTLVELMKRFTDDMFEEFLAKNGLMLIDDEVTR